MRTAAHEVMSPGHRRGGLPLGYPPEDRSGRRCCWWGCAALVWATTLAACDVKLGKPQLLWLLWLVPMLIAFQIYAWRTKRRLLGQFAAPELIARIESGVSRPRQLLKAALVIVAVALALVSLTEVKYGFSWDEVKREGVDLVVALDVSDSMLVQDAEADGKLSRLERAKRKVTDLLRLLEGDRIALVAFSGTAFVECPLTLDYAAAEVFLESIDTDLIPVKGTAIGEAIRSSLKAFEGGSAKSQAIILITDGEDHSGKALEAAEEAKTQGVRIYVIGIGRDEGAPIPDANGGFRKDRRGEMVISKLDETTLQKMALTTGGAYVRSVTGDVDLEKIYTQGIKATLEDKDLASKRRQRWEERFQWILAVAILLLMIEPLVPERRRKSSASTTAAALIILGLALPGAASAQTRPPTQKAPAPPSVVHNPPMPAPSAPGGPAGPLAAPPPPAAPGPTGPAKKYDDPVEAFADGAYDQALQGFTDAQVENPEDVGLMLDVGSAHYKMANYAEAEKAFGRAALSGEPKYKGQALYNLGNNAYKQGKLEDAIRFYQAALEVDPNDEDAKFNIEFVRDEIRRRQEEAQKRQEQQQQQGQDQQQQEQQKGQDQQQKQDEQQQQQQGQDQEKEQQQAQEQQTAEGEKKDQGDKQDGQGAEAQPATPLTQEEAQRYLDSLGDDKPVQKQKAKGSGRRQVDKDW
jgi:Ca-activated chloride channel homolog